jgi:hypothetical protein
MKHLLAAAYCAALVSIAAPASAHHSAAQFDFRGPATVTGIVKSIRPANPHLRLVMTVTDAKRGTRDIEFEGHSLNNFYRSGWKPDMVKVGDKIEVFIAPRKDGEDGGYVTGVKTADGKVIGRPPTGGAQAEAEGRAPVPAQRPAQ